MDGRVRRMPMIKVALRPLDQIFEGVMLICDVIRDFVGIPEVLISSNEVRIGLLLVVFSRNKITFWRLPDLLLDCQWSSHHTLSE
jgi:hypothetical protein